MNQTRAVIGVLLVLLRISPQPLRGGSIEIVSCRAQRTRFLIIQLWVDFTRTCTRVEELVFLWNIITIFDIDLEQAQVRVFTRTPWFCVKPAVSRGWHDPGYFQSLLLNNVYLLPFCCACAQVLRVLGQRFPQEVDAAVGKISRSVAKTKAALPGESEDEDNTKEAKREAAQREEALSSLLVSSFAGAELAQRLPLEHEQQNDVSVFGENLSDFLVVQLSAMFIVEF